MDQKPLSTGAQSLTAKFALPSSVYQAASSLASVTHAPHHPVLQSPAGKVAPPSGGVYPLTTTPNNQSASTVKTEIKVEIKSEPGVAPLADTTALTGTCLFHLLMSLCAYDLELILFWTEQQQKPWMWCFYRQDSISQVPLFDWSLVPPATHHWMSPTKTDELTKMPFGMWTCWGPRNHLLGWGFRSPQGKGNLAGMCSRRGNSLTTFSCCWQVRHCPSRMNWCRSLQLRWWTLKQSWIAPVEDQAVPCLSQLTRWLMSIVRRRRLVMNWMIRLAVARPNLHPLLRKVRVIWSD